jgi:RimJ/RimL family protein N-acetyltransferase
MDKQPGMELIGPRVVLRGWQGCDRQPFATMNADPKVMEFFPQLLTPEQSLASFERLKKGIEDRGWGLWVVDISGDFAGFTGLAETNFQAPFTPCIEIGWRFQTRFWGQGYALESARLALRFGFENLRLEEIVSFTARINKRSERLMQRLGMRASPKDDFEHPKIPPGHPVRDHVFYRISNTPELLQRLNRGLEITRR